MWRGLAWHIGILQRRPDWMHAISMLPLSPLPCLCLCTYLTFAQKVAFLPCPPSSFSRLEVYRNEIFFDGLVRMNPPSPQLPCTSSIRSWPYLAPHLHHLFMCLPHKTVGSLRATSVFSSLFPQCLAHSGHSTSSDKPWELCCAKYGKEVGTQVWVNKDAIHSAYMYWLFKADCPAALPSVVQGEHRTQNQRFSSSPS